MTTPPAPFPSNVARAQPRCWLNPFGAVVVRVGVITHTSRLSVPGAALRAGLEGRASGSVRVWCGQLSPGRSIDPRSPGAAVAMAGAMKSAGRHVGWQLQAG